MPAAKRSLLLLLPLALLAPGLAWRANADAGPAPLVVHEWGTFTSMQGVDGVGLEGLQREEEALPPCVYSRAEVRDCPLRARGYKGLETPVTGATQKMETPVIYFHTKVPLRARVRVDFVDGLLSQWYPVSDRLGPPEGQRGGAPLDVGAVGRSYLSWEVDLQPGAEPPAGLPAVAADDPWSFAREVDAAWVRTVPRVAPRAGPTETERYLFYRGLGAFGLPLVTAPGPSAGQVHTTNVGREAVLAAFGLTVDAARTEVRWAALGPIAPGEAVTFDGQAARARPLAEGVASLRAAVLEVLLAQGLFGDEARAMVRTWTRSWFGSPGTRVLWLVPRARVDAILPLEIDPAPAEVVRVFVGRLEVVTPAVEAEVERALLERLSGDAALRTAADASLAAFDRFLEPHLRAALRSTTDARVRASAEELLAGLR